MAVGLVTGLIGGALAGMLGIGGGAIFVPALVILLGTEQIVAQGTSLAVIVLTATVGTVQHLRNGTVDMGVTRWTAPLAVPCGFAGAWLAGELDADTLQRIFGAVIVLVAVRMLLQSVRQREAPAATPAPGARDADPHTEAV